MKVATSMPYRCLGALGAGALWMAFGTAAGCGVHAAGLERLGVNAGCGVTAEVRAGETLGAAGVIEPTAGTPPGAREIRVLFVSTVGVVVAGR
jgi:hypothetical protein